MTEKSSPLSGDSEAVLTEGYGLYVRVRRGLYARVSRSGQRRGGLSWGFEPRPRWRQARRCSYVIARDGLTCPLCGCYDTHYAMTGERSYCNDQMTRGQRARMEVA